MAKKDILPLRFPVEQTETNVRRGKPAGLWYAIGTEWIDWVESEMPEWMGDKFYKIEISDKVLKIDTEEKFTEFSKEYAYDHPMFSDNIDWIKLSKVYSGIEIAPYRSEFRLNHMWYYGWDIASGCIWKKDAISKIEKIIV